MSERAGLAGVDGPDHTIEHKGKVYHISPGIDDNVMLIVERKLYDKDVKALMLQKSAMSTDEYSAELAKLRDRFAAGYYAMESPRTLELLKTQSGALLLLQALMNDVSAGELVELMVHRGEELLHTLTTVIDVSYPALAKLPKAVRRRKDKSRKVRRRG